MKTDGSLWAMGNNYYGELGNGVPNSPTYVFNTPQQIVSNDVIAVAAGSSHSLFLKSDGSLWAMGWNSEGQLGDGTTSDARVPEQVVSNGVVAIAGGGYNSLFLKSDGSLWAMGLNYNGQLGDGTTNNSTVPVQIVSNNVAAIAAGMYHSLFIKSDGSLWAMGNNAYGQLGDGTANSVSTPEQIVSNGVVAVAAGVYDSVFLKSDGSVWSMGNNPYGQMVTAVCRSKSFQAASRGSLAVRVRIINSSSKPMAAFGPWAATAPASWATDSKPPHLVSRTDRAAAATGFRGTRVDDAEH